MASIICLRAATHRLLTTPVKELPSIAIYLATAFADCGSILSTPQTKKKRLGEFDTSLLVQKVKARITSLLQDKTVEGRWTAVVLVKAVIEAGQWEILQGCEAWVRALLAILGRPDPLSTKKLCLITLTRIFQLAYPYQTLVREITTPSLPTFITSCLNLVSVKLAGVQTRQLKKNTPLLETVLHAFVELLPRHPTIFRPFSSQIHGLTLSLIGSFARPDSLSDSNVSLAKQLFIALHQCAPKNTGGEEWLKACRSTISSIHQTSDHFFRGVVEQWESVDASLRQSSRPRNYDLPVGDDGPDALGLPGWHGIYAGGERLESLLKLLVGFVSMPTNSTVSMPIGSILDLSNRLLSVTYPSFDGEDSSQGGTELNPEITREEKEGLWAELPKLHIATMNLLRVIVERFGLGSVAIAQSCLDQTLWMFEVESSNINVRTIAYQVLNAILPIIGPSMTKSGVLSLASLVRCGCQDVLPFTTDRVVGIGQPLSGKAVSKPNPTTGNVDSFLSRNLTTTNCTEHPFPNLKAAAADLLTRFLSFVPTEHIPPSLRAEIDRTAIVTNNESFMMASVLNPVTMTSSRHKTPSIMPFLARSHPDRAGVEALLRPRMPVLMGAAISSIIDLEDEDEFEPQPTTKFSTSSNVFPEELTRPVNKRVLDDVQMADQQSALSSESQGSTTSQAKRIRVEAMQSFTPPTPAVPEQPTNLSAPVVEELLSVDEQRPVTPSILAKTCQSLTTAPDRVVMRNISSDTMRSETSVAYGADPSAVIGVDAGEGDDGSEDEIPTLNIEPDTDGEDEDV
ncbi:uncharacterized protein PADG_02220 [Paracoccidioides brasiliensis Pb18]|uniref:Pre-rRNA-processing protein RIX1 n=1 Tax=Paracoccidioides brasiliensis (strain Pb18) TaxID=502780 RepID=C1G254_PARBD|nr:uncharacterized protein PADG_02220 [Paracoccidioides brasiliensis Pb18]EEH46070.2 hypothetical protein PADG_02220 [Paracoccidioides brasiliensis Pb18]